MDSVHRALFYDTYGNGLQIDGYLLAFQKSLPSSERMSSQVIVISFAIHNCVLNGHEIFIDLLSRSIQPVLIVLSRILLKPRPRLPQPSYSKNLLETYKPFSTIHMIL